MKIKNQDSFVEFEFKELSNLQKRHDVSCRIKTFSDGFTGEINSVWFSDENIKSFIEKLEELEKNRKGLVELFNMSSGSDANPLEFKIFTTDNLGHLAIRPTLRKLIYFKDSYEISIISVVFEIDAGLLNLIINDFKKLFMI